MNTITDEKKIKESIAIKKRKGIYLLAESGNKTKKFKPWLGDLFCFLYDRIMEKSVFPDKFSGSISRHYEILNAELKTIENKKILELACGSGDAVKFMSFNNDYTGIDISRGLLNIAKKKFSDADFQTQSFSLQMLVTCHLLITVSILEFAICR